QRAEPDRREVRLCPQPHARDWSWQALTPCPPRQGQAPAEPASCRPDSIKTLGTQRLSGKGRPICRKLLSYNTLRHRNPSASQASTIKELMAVFPGRPGSPPSQWSLVLCCPAGSSVGGWGGEG